MVFIGSFLIAIAIYGQMSQFWHITLLTLGIYVVVKLICLQLKDISEWLNVMNRARYK